MVFWLAVDCAPVLLRRIYDVQINAHNRGSLPFGCKFLAVNCGERVKGHGTQREKVIHDGRFKPH